MPALPTLVIEASDGTTKASVDCITAAANRNLVEMWNATATLDRSEWLATASNLDEVNDRLRIERGDGTTLFEGRFVNDARDGNTIVVSINSYEQDAIDAEPTQGRVIYENVADSTIAADGIDAVSSLTKGTIETGASSVSFTFANANQSKRIRDAAEPAGQDLRYNSDQSVDFLNRLGSDKSSITISSANQNIVDELSVGDNSRDPVTHIKGLGAQQGGKQVRATATVPSYSSGRKVWREYENTDIMQVDRLQAIVDRLADEYNNEQCRLIVSATLLDVDVSIGDRITVDLPQHSINRLMRITDLTEQLTSAGQRFIATLTNRDVERGGDRKRRDDLQRFNRGDQGFVDRDQVNSGWNPAGDTIPQTIEVPNWPDDVVREDEVTLTVQGRAWRSPVTSTGHTHSINATSANNADFTQVEESTVQGALVTLTSDGAWKEAASFTPSVDTTAVHFDVSVINIDADYGWNGEARIRNTSTGNAYPNSTGKPMNVGDDTDDRASQGSLQQTDPTNCNGEKIVLELRQDSNFSVAPDVEVQAAITAEGQHTHAVSDTTSSTVALSPEVIDTFDGNQYYPSDVDIAVDGSAITTLSGNSTADWQTDVDLAGELSAGANTITATPTSTRGSVNLILYSELFRSGGPAP